MMATYNGEKYVREQIVSILNQSYSEWKLYVRDDGSTDHTIDIINEYQSIYPEKIVFIQDRSNLKGSKENFSIIYETVEEADYYAFCDQDDIWYPNKLLDIISVIKKYDRIPTLIYHDVKLVDEKLNDIANSFFKYTSLSLGGENNIHQTLQYNCVPGCTMLLNKKLKGMIQSIPNECIMHDWWILLVTLCLEGNIVYLDKVLGQYRQHNNNQIGAVKGKNILQMFIKCFDVHRVRYYINNNRRMRQERITQTEELLKQYGDKITSNNLEIIMDYLDILKSNKKIRNLIKARKDGYIFYNLIYMMKFYLL